MSSTSEILQLVSLIPAYKELDAIPIVVPDALFASLKPRDASYNRSAATRRLLKPGAQPTALDLMMALQINPNLSFAGEIRVHGALDLDYEDPPHVSNAPLDPSIKDQELQIQQRLVHLEQHYEARLAHLKARIDAQLEALSKEVEEILAMQGEVEDFKRAVLSEGKSWVRYARMLRLQPPRIRAFFTRFYEMLVVFFLTLRAKFT